MVIFDGKHLKYQWTTDEVPGTYYGMSGMSGNGWMDQELYKHWFQDPFLKYAVPTRPLLLLMDGHSSHYEPSSMELAKNNDLILFCLPPHTTQDSQPHTTQDSQPLDCTVFGPLKRHWSTVCHEFLHNHPGIVINKYNFPGYLQRLGYLPSHLLLVCLVVISMEFTLLIAMQLQYHFLLRAVVRQTIHKNSAANSVESPSVLKCHHFRIFSFISGFFLFNV